jgi:hypothetical protein
MDSGTFYRTLGDVTESLYREVLEKVISRGYLKGLGGTGTQRVLNLTEEAVRLLVVVDRAGVFDT